MDNAQFPNPYQLTRPAWRKDSRAFTFEYNQRGHQVYRVLVVEAASGHVRPVIEEIGSHSPLYPALVAPNSSLPIQASSGSGIELCGREAGRSTGGTART